MRKDIAEMLQSQSTEELLVLLEEAQDEENYAEIYSSIRQIVLARGDVFRAPERVKTIVQGLDKDMKDFTLAIKHELRLMPIWLIGLAFIQFLFVGDIFILPLPGIFLFLAILCLFYRKRITYLIIGIGIIAVGVSNLLITIFIRITTGIQGNLNFAFDLILLIVYGCLLIFWGIRTMHKYWLLAPPPGANITEEDEKEDEDYEAKVEEEQVSEPIEVIVGKEINEENLERVKVLIFGLKSVFKSGKSAEELSDLLNSMIKSQSDAILLIEAYRKKFGIDLVTEVKKSTTSYTLIRKLLSKFIEFDVVETEFPHGYKSLNN
jgi:hypothetical protein